MAVSAYHFAECSVPGLSLHQHRNQNLKYEVSSWKSKQITFVQSNTTQAYLIKHTALTSMLHVSACA